MTHNPEVQAGPSSLPNETSNPFADPSEESVRNREEHPGSWKTTLRELQPFVFNFKALASRFIQLAYRPANLAPIILDYWTLSLSIIWTERRPGPDLLYPFSSLVKQKSGGLARLLQGHSRDLQLKNLHVAASPREGIDPPRIAVIDLDEVPADIIERGYTVTADFYGFVAMTMFLEILISPIVYIFSPIDFTPYLEWLSGWVATLFGNWIGSWFAFFAGHRVFGRRTPMPLRYLCHLRYLHLCCIAWRGYSQACPEIRYFYAKLCGASGSRLHRSLDRHAKRCGGNRGE